MPMVMSREKMRRVLYLRLWCDGRLHSQRPQPTAAPKRLTPICPDLFSTILGARISSFGSSRRFAAPESIAKQPLVPNIPASNIEKHPNRNDSPRFSKHPAADIGFYLPSLKLFLYNYALNCIFGWCLVDWGRCFAIARRHRRGGLRWQW